MFSSPTLYTQVEMCLIIQSMAGQLSLNNITTSQSIREKKGTANRTEVALAEVSVAKS